MAKDIATLRSEAASFLPDNLTRAISAEDIRVRITDLIDFLEVIYNVMQMQTTLAACRVLSDSNQNIASAPSTLDSITLVAGDRILLTAQTNPEQNGVWVFNGSATALTRPADFDTGKSMRSASTDITEGTYGGKTYEQTAAGVVDTNDQVWSEKVVSSSGHNDRREVGSETTRQVELQAIPTTKVSGFTEQGRGIVEDSHFTVSGRTVTFTDDAIFDGTSVTLSYESAAAPTVNERASASLDTADGTSINLAAVDSVEIKATNTNSVFTSSGGKTDLVVVNRKSTGITVDGLAISGLEYTEHRYFDGAWAIVFRNALSLILAALLFCASGYAQETNKLGAEALQSHVRARSVATSAALTSLDVDARPGVADIVTDGERFIVRDAGTWWYDASSTAAAGPTVVGGGTLAGNFRREVWGKVEYLTTAQRTDGDVFSLLTGDRAIVLDSDDSIVRVATGTGIGSAATFTQFPEYVHGSFAGSILSDNAPASMLFSELETELESVTATITKRDRLAWSVVGATGTVTLTADPTDPEEVLFVLRSGLVYTGTATGATGVNVTLSGAGNRTATIDAGDFGINDGDKVLVIYE